MLDASIKFPVMNPVRLSIETVSGLKTDFIAINLLVNQITVAFESLTG